VQFSTDKKFFLGSLLNPFPLLGPNDVKCVYQDQYTEKNWPRYFNKVPVMDKWFDTYIWEKQLLSELTENIKNEGYDQHHWKNHH
jgi:hypothetical protein